MHCEINSWQDFLDLVYHESLVRGQYNDFISILEGPVRPYQELKNSTDHATKNKVVNERSETEPQGAGARVKAVEYADKQNSIFLASIENSCTNHIATDFNDTMGVGLPLIAKKVKEHHDNTKTCYNKLQVRLIGAQAIKLAQLFYRLIVLHVKMSPKPKNFYGWLSVRSGKCLEMQAHCLIKSIATTLI